MMPPMIMKIAIYDEGKKKLNLWLPLLLVYLLLAPVFLFVLPFVLIGGFILWILRGAANPFSLGFWIYELWCALKGTIIEVNSKANRVYIRVF